MSNLKQVGVFVINLWCEACGSEQPHTVVPRLSEAEVYLCKGPCRSFTTGLVQVQEEEGRPVTFFRVLLTDNLTITEGYTNAGTEDISAEAEDQDFPSL